MPNTNDLLARSEKNFQAFEAAAAKHLDALSDLIDRYVADAGNVEATSQKLCLKNRLAQLDNYVNGTTAEDMKASEEELTAQLERFCATHNLPLMSADELLVEPEVQEHQELGAWLEYFIERWNARPQ
ncbi:MAG: hypothetical protein AWU57_332 [Marinobacter sp. T13-3]|mgnify:CR=1 FL=1|nr:MAG: hypothetical protein AWU57_332 [Marinobacter sp. T13-3]